MTPQKRNGVNRITANKMRQLFNKIIFPRVKQGELTPRVEWSNHPSPPKADEPHCTESQIVDYFDNSGLEVARVHQFLRPDGTLGASGKPDPKRIVVDGVTYRLSKRKG